VVTGNTEALSGKLFNHELAHVNDQSVLGVYYIPLHAISQGMGQLSQLFGASPAHQAAFLEQAPFTSSPYSTLLTP